MQVVERLPWSGRVRITTRYLDGRVEVECLDNLITNAGKSLLRDVLQGIVSDGQIKQVAWGSGDTAPAAGNEALGSELGRKQVTARTPGAAGVLTTTVYLAPYDAVASIKELGWFAGAAATDTPGSGVLVARVLWTKSKTNLESVVVDRIDTIG